MEDRIRALETELNTLKTTLNTSKWWLGVLGAFLIGSLGYTNLFSITNAVDDKFAKEGGEGIIEKLKASERTASDSATILKSAAEKTGEFEELALFSCPSRTENVDALWVSWGCVGQYSTKNSCENYWFAGGGKTATYPCEPVTLFKRKQ